MPETISLPEFQKLDLKVGKIVKIDDVENADKLYKLEVDLGGEKLRTLVAGIKQHYDKNKLNGKKIIVVANLEPVRIRGIESNGMLLAAVSDDRKKVVLLSPDSEIETGTKVS